MQLDTPLHLYRNPDNRFVAGFIGSPTMNFIKGALKKDDDHFFIEVSLDYKVHLGSNIPNVFKNRIGNELEIGIRPENIIISEEKITGNCDTVVEVMAYENMGNEQLVYLTLKDQTLIARRNAQDSVELGTNLFVSFPTDKIIFIDPVSGKTIL
jgi:ABC-type sugar transport system ATPase subunit